MADHFTKVRELEEAILRGDLEGARAPAQWLAEHQAIAGLPAGTESYVAEMKNAAKAVATSSDIGSAAVASAQAVATCGACHAAAKVTAKMPEASAVSDMPGSVGHMHGHQHAIAQLYRGLAAPSDELWKRGAEELKVAPLAEQDLAKVTKEIQKFEARVHELAGRALDAPDTGAKVAIYAEITGACATCHGLHGRIWGPGLPKTN
jgi:cytochrome c553